MNEWEKRALEYHYPDGATSADLDFNPATDRLIYPGLYSKSGFDVMAALSLVTTRPNPQVDLGPIDCSVALIICDLRLPDTPAVYVSEAFVELTGYSQQEALGRNCRFLQFPGGKMIYGSPRPPAIDVDKLKKMRQAVKNAEEVQVEIVNYRKCGQTFNNLVTIVPIPWATDEPCFLVGFLAEV